MSKSPNLEIDITPIREYLIKYTLRPEESWDTNKHRDFIRCANDAQDAVNIFRRELGIAPYIIFIKLI